MTPRLAFATGSTFARLSRDIVSRDLQRNYFFKGTADPSARDVLEAQIVPLIHDGLDQVQRFLLIE